MWGSLGGTWIAAPHAVAVGPDRTALFVVGTDHIVRVRWRIDGEWGGWTVLPGTVVSAPFAIASADNGIDLFAVDHKHSILHRQWCEGEWTDWRWLSGEAGGPTITAPRAVWSAPDRLEVFALGTDLGMWHLWRDGDRWRDEWTCIGSLWLTPPYVVCREPGTIDAVAINSESALAYSRMRHGSWSGWQTDDNVSILRPYVVTNDEGLQVFVPGEDRGLYHYTFNGEWRKPTALHGTVISGPRAVARPHGGLDVFMVGEDSAVFHKTFRDGVWREWESLGGRAFSAPAVVRHNGVVELFTLGWDSAVWHLTVTLAK